DRRARGRRRRGRHRARRPPRRRRGAGAAPAHRPRAEGAAGRPGRHGGAVAGQASGRAEDEAAMTRERDPSDPKDPDGEGAELIRLPGTRAEADAENLEHLRANRRLIVRRSLLASAVGGVVPLPVMDEYLAARVRAGMLMKLAERRQVDLAQSSAELLA